MDEFAPYVPMDQHMVDGVSIAERREEYRARAREMHEDMDFAGRWCLHFDGEKLYFDDDEDDLLDDSEEIFMVDIKGSLQREQLADTTL